MKPILPATDLQVIDWGRLGYGEAFQRQKEMVAQRIADAAPDRLILVEHPPTVTLGRGGGTGDLCVRPEILQRKKVELHYVDRGGKATFHGPGQLVAYPIVKLAEKDLHRFLDRLLDAVADVLRAYELVPERQPANPGLWVGGAKIASVGIAVQKWVTYHGIALNVSTDPEWFRLITPCGNADEIITSMENERGRDVDVGVVKQRFVRAFCRRFGFRPPSESRDPLPRPAWLVRPAPDPAPVRAMEKRLERLRLATVCQSAHCPNLGECFGRGTATFMILGTRCTRRCRFCAVEKGPPLPVDPDEPGRVARAVRSLGLTHAVVTSVTRDDLADGGTGQFVRTIQHIRSANDSVQVETLVPDFNGSVSALQAVCDARPDVFNHNIETAARLYETVRPGAGYRRSLGVLSYAAARGLWTKSGLMLGLGETETEIRQTLSDLRRAGCAALTLGQYLAPSRDHVPVARYVSPAEFDEWAETARSLGFEAVAAGPLVRSSYRAEKLIIPGSSALQGGLARRPGIDSRPAPPGNESPGYKQNPAEAG